MPSRNAAAAGSPRVAALGYYGFRNLGDEAVLAGIRVALRPRVPDARFLALSNDPADTLRLHPGIHAANRWRWREAASALRGTDLFILGGGSLLQDATSSASVVWYGLMAMLARRCSRRVLWWGQGIGPLRTPLARAIVALIGNQADAITVRDKESASLLKAVGVRGSITLVADPAFALEPETGSPKNGSILVSLRPWKDDLLGRNVPPDEFIDLLRALWPSSAVAALPMHLPDDTDFMRNYFKSRASMNDWAERGATPARVLGDFPGAPCVVAMRLHALIFASRCATPFVALSYDPKVDALANAAGQQDALVAVENITAERLRDVMTRVRDTAPQRRAALTVFAEEQRRMACLPAEIAASLLAR